MALESHAATSDVGQTIPVEAPCGPVLGRSVDGVQVFRGLPYAEPPTGPRRWAPPVRRARWSAPRNATTIGACAPQSPSRMDDVVPDQIGATDEDCLLLDVWTADSTGRRPVMVWIHGGAFVIGAGNCPAYDGRRLAAAGDVVLVAINYRLGALGFVNLRDATGGALPATGNEGLLDQICALEWVRDNIAAFGGDPDNVTLFGESAGAMSIACLLGMPRAQGLFHKAILQSGAAHIGYTRERSVKAGRALLEVLGVTPEEAPRLRERPVEEIMAAQKQLIDEAQLKGDPRRLGQMPFAPVVDGEWLKQRPIDAIRAGASRDIPLIIGTMRDEFRLFSVGIPRMRSVGAAALHLFVLATCRLAAPAILRAYKEGTHFDRLSAIIGDRIFWLPAVRLAEARTDGAPRRLYRIDHESALRDGIFKAAHFVDAGLVFGTQDSAPYFGPGPDADRSSAELIRAWTSFARTGAPEVGTGIQWDDYRRDRATMVFGDGLAHVVQDPDSRRRRAWRRIGEAIGFK